MKWSGFRKIKKEQIIVIFIIGLLLMVITIPTKESDTSKAQEEDFLNLQGITDADYTDGQNIGQTAWQVSSEEYTTKMEEQLKNCLEQMDGVGKVQVMITLKTSTEAVLAKDKTTANSSANGEGDSETNSDTESSEVTVFEETDSNLTPYVIKEMSPVVKGVFVVAEGGDNPVVKQNISDAVMALFSIESHKIMVVKMKEG